MKKNFLTTVMGLLIAINAFSTTVIADCESEYTNLCLDWWSAYAENSTIDFEVKYDEAFIGDGYMSANFSIAPGDWGVVFGFWLVPDDFYANLSGATGVTFYHKGVAGTLEVKTNQYAETFDADIPAHSAWTQVTVPFSSMKGTWGSSEGITLTDLSKVEIIQFGISSGSGTFDVDHIPHTRLFRAGSGTHCPGVGPLWAWHGHVAAKRQLHAAFPAHGSDHSSHVGTVARGSGGWRDLLGSGAPAGLGGRGRSGHF